MSVCLSVHSVCMRFEMLQNILMVIGVKYIAFTLYNG